MLDREGGVRLATRGMRRFGCVDLELDGHARVRAKLEDSNQRLAAYFFMAFGGSWIVTSAVLTGFTLDRQRRAVALE